MAHTAQDQSIHESKLIDNVKADKNSGAKGNFVFSKNVAKLFKYVAKAKNLKSLELSGPGVADDASTEIREALGENQFLTYLSLRKSKIELKGLGSLAQGVQKNIALKTLILAESQMATDIGSVAQAIGAAIAKHPTLTRFDWRGFHLSANAVSFVAQALIKHNTLTYLDLSDNPIGDEGISFICKGLVANTSLKQLVLNNLGLVTKESCKLLSGALSKCTSLGRLSFDSNRVIDSSSILDFVTVFSVGKLTVLHLSNCKIDDEIAAVLFSLACMNNRNLRKLYLSNNLIKVVDKWDWAGAGYLNELYLDGNAIGDAGAIAFGQALQFNRALEVLNLASCGITSSGLQALIAAVQKNPIVQRVMIEPGDEGRGLKEANKCLERNQRLAEALAQKNTSGGAAETISAAFTSGMGTSVMHLGNLGLNSLELVNKSIRKICADPSVVKQTMEIMLYRNRLPDFPLVPLQPFAASLISLDLSFNRLTGIPDDFALLVALQTLNLRNNSIAVLNPILGLMGSLLNLYMENNPFSIVPITLLKSGLKQFRTSGSNLPPTVHAVMRCWGQESVSLANSNLTTLPSELFFLNSITDLNLSNNRLDGLSHEIGSLSRLKSLDLRSNLLESLPWQLAQLAMLTTIRLEGNPLARIPTELVASTSATQLREYLQALKSGSTPIYRSKLMLVGYENVGKTTLANILKQYWGIEDPLAKKKKNAIKTSKSDDLSSQRSRASTGASLLARPLQSLSRSREEGSSSAAKSLSGSVASKPRSTTSPPATVSNDAVSSKSSSKRGGSSTPSLQDTSKEREKESSSSSSRKPSNASVVSAISSPHRSDLLSGASSMKQSTRPSSRGTDLETDRTADSEAALKTVSTDGIEVVDLVVQHQGKTIVFHLWDFAGQEVYHSTHSFFLSKRSVFLMVFDASKPLEVTQKSLDYWLSTIAAKAPDSPVLCVGTHADDPLCTTAHQQNSELLIQKRYACKFDIRVIAFISAKTRDGVRALLDLLIQHAASQPHMGEEFPNTWLLFEEQLQLAARETSPPIITTDKFAEIAQRCGLPTKEVFAVQDLFHQMGVLVSFRNARARVARTPLERLVVLDPMWLASLFKAIITFKHNFVEQGVLEHSNAVHIWRNEQHSTELHKVYLEILERFEVIFPLRRAYKDGADAATVERSLVPSLLPADTPKFLDYYGWSPYGNMQEKTSSAKPANRHVATRVIEMPFVPSGLFGRLLARSLTVAKAVHFWRTGVILSLKKGTTMGYVWTDNASHIYIQAYGDEAAYLLYVLDFNFSTLFQLNSFQTFEPRFFSLCNCSGCNESSAKLYASQKAVTTAVLDECHKFETLDLVRLVVQGKSTAQCARSKHELPIVTFAPDLALEDLESLRIDVDLPKKEQLGRGGFSEVYQSQYKHQKVAVKILTLPKGKLDVQTELSQFREFRHEAWIWKKLTHPNLLQLIGVSWQRSFFVMELCTSGSLDKFLKAPPVKVTWEHRLRIASDIVSGVSYMHSLTPPAMHRDLKSPNVLLVGTKPSELMAKIIDFGLSLQGVVASGRVVDNALWLAPEILQDLEYTVKADIWSVGMILVELVTMRFPFAETNWQFQSQLETDIILGLKPALPLDTPPAYRTLVLQCLSLEPASRPPAPEILTALKALRV